MVYLFPSPVSDHDLRDQKLSGGTGFAPSKLAGWLAQERLHPLSVGGTTMLPVHLRPVRHRRFGHKHLFPLPHAFLRSAPSSPCLTNYPLIVLSSHHQSRLSIFVQRKRCRAVFPYLSKEKGEHDNDTAANTNAITAGLAYSVCLVEIGSELSQSHSLFPMTLLGRPTACMPLLAGWL